MTPFSRCTARSAASLASEGKNGSAYEASASAGLPPFATMYDRSWSRRARCDSKASLDPCPQRARRAAPPAARRRTTPRARPPAPCAACRGRRGPAGRAPAHSDLGRATAWAASQAPMLATSWATPGRDGGELPRAQLRRVLLDLAQPRQRRLGRADAWRRVAAGAPAPTAAEPVSRRRPARACAARRGAPGDGRGTGPACRPRRRSATSRARSCAPSRR